MREQTGRGIDAENKRNLVLPGRGRHTGEALDGATMPLKLIPEIHRATHRIGVHLARIAGLGLNQPEAHILAHLASFGDSTISQVHQAFAHKRSTLTSILDRLDARGLITRITNPRDRREFIVRLTASGKPLAKRAYRELESIEKHALRHLNKKQLEGFAETLKALESALKHPVKI